jgi:hypothetical protein
LRDNTKDLEHLFEENLNEIFFDVFSQCRRKTFFGGTK